MKYKYENASEFLIWFLKNEEDLVEKMKKTEHSLSGEPNPHHIEGSIFTHTLMVYNEGIHLKVNKLVQIALLLHDIGKVNTIKHDKETNKTSFNGHEGYSYYMAIEILNKLDLFNSEKELILNMIVHHSSFWNIGKKTKKYWTSKDLPLLKNLMDVVYCDARGRIFLNSRAENPISDDFKNLMENIQPTRDDIVAQYIPTITLMIGVPKSGKTTFLKNQKYSDNTVIISRDDILMEFAQDGLTYNKAWKWAEDNGKHKEIDKSFTKRLRDAFEKNLNIVIDNTNVNRKSRNRILSSTPSHYKRNAIVFATGLNEIYKRNGDDAKISKDLFYEVFHNMITRFKTPTYGEFADIKYIFD